MSTVCLCLLVAGVASTSSTPSVSRFSDPAFSWNNGEPEHTLDDDGSAITIKATPNLDYWSRTFYSPLLMKTNAQTLLMPIEAGVEATISMSFTLAPRAQFDQAGIMVLVDENTWVKAGIEFTDGVPRLSCVVTNDGFSDWSTQKWPVWDAETQTTSINVRLTKLWPGETQGPALVFEAASTDMQWQQIRIASLRSGEKPWRMGIFAISPIAAQGSYARFYDLLVGPKVDPVHHTDAGHVDGAAGENLEV
jgi:regulation of enolase protein 1 (concanavalin A-like superfamily)